MYWIPDWLNMDRKDFEISYIDNDGEIQFTESVEVSVEKDGLYRLLEQPLFGEILTWGDLIKAKETKEGVLEMIEITQHASHTRADYLLGDKPTLTNDGYLGKIMAEGGFWQQDMGGLLIIFYPPGKTEKDYR